MSVCSVRTVHNIQLTTAICTIFSHTYTHTYTNRLSKYHLWVRVSSIGTASLASIHSEYREHYQLCWTHNHVHGLNLLNWGILTFWVVVYWFVSVYITIYVRKKLLGGGLRKTLSARKEMLRSSYAYVLVYSVVSMYLRVCILHVCMYLYDSEIPRH